MDIFLSNKLYCKKSNIPEAGYGVFTKESIKKGEVIEVSRFVKVGFDTFNAVDDNILSVLYGFPKKRPDYFGIVLGYGSLYNSSLDDKTNNVDWITDEVNEVFIYTAVIDIVEGSELYIYYDNYEFNTKKKN